MTYYVSSGSYVDVEAVRGRADTLNETSTEIFPEIENGTFFWRINDPKIGQRITVLPDVTLVKFSSGESVIQTVTSNYISDIFQVRIDLETNSAEFVSITEHFVSDQDTSLQYKFSDSIINAGSYTSVVGPGYSNSDNTEYYRWLDEFYISVSGSIFPNLGSFYGPFGFTFADVGRFLITTGDEATARDKAWGPGWIETTRQLDLPDGITMEEVEDSVAPLLEPDVLIERPRVPDSKNFEVVRKITDFAAFEALDLYSSTTTNLIGFVPKKFALPVDPDIKIEVFSGAENLGSVKKLAGQIGSVIQVGNAGISAWNAYQRGGEGSEAAERALKAGAADFMVSYFSGHVGVVVSSGVAYGLGGVVVGTAGVPVLAAAGIALGAGVVAGWVAEDYLNARGRERFPDWWPEEVGAKRIAASLDGAADPAWIYDADANRMILSLQDTDRGGWRTTATRLGLDDMLDLKPVNFSERGGKGADFIAGAAGRDNLHGRAGNDRVAGGESADKLYGEAGRDRLYGGLGADMLKGGKGGDWIYAGDDRARDVFVFANENESGTSKAKMDHLLEFDIRRDVIDLSALDADSRKGDQSFRFVDDFIDARGRQSDGQVMAFRDGDRVKVRIDIDGDSRTDMTILVEGVRQLSEDNFIL